MEANKYKQTKKQKKTKTNNTIFELYLICEIRVLYRSLIHILSTNHSISTLVKWRYYIYYIYTHWSMRNSASHTCKICKNYPCAYYNGLHSYYYYHYYLYFTVSVSISNSLVFGIHWHYADATRHTMEYLIVKNKQKKKTKTITQRCKTATTERGFKNLNIIIRHTYKFNFMFVLF